MAEAHAWHSEAGAAANGGNSEREVMRGNGGFMMGLVNHGS